ncbi:hypothetical protein BC830DRAFT_1146434 [Chytriomyces sp. MP71]|nr:hypothetical protein BC830DRAFT_1146434 [Chytriomyces sp. MP71]
MTPAHGLVPQKCRLTISTLLVAITHSIVNPRCLRKIQKQVSVACDRNCTRLWHRILHAVKLGNRTRVHWWTRDPPDICIPLNPIVAALAPLRKLSSRCGIVRARGLGQGGRNLPWRCGNVLAEAMRCKRAADAGSKLGSTGPCVNHAR